MPQTPSISFETRKVVLFHPARSEFLLQSTSRGFSLPEVSIPSRERATANVNAAIHRMWNLDVLSIGEIASESIPGTPLACRYEVVELLSGKELSPEGLTAKPTSALRAGSFLQREDFSVLERIAASNGPLTLCGQSGPFSSFGWFDELQTWLERVLPAFGLRRTGRFEQFNAGSCFSLIRFETNRDAVWFKAVGPPNVREYAITQALAVTMPRYSPTVLAACPEWHAWLSLEAQGELLSQSEDVTKWQTTVAALAKLQIDSIRQVPQILAAGARDMRIPVLWEQSQRFFEILELLMGQQSKTSPAPLSAGELRSLRQNVRDILLRLGDVNIPDTLGHFDLNPGNVVVSPTNCTFLDWSEAVVVPPLLTLQYLLEHFHLALPKEGHNEARLIASYAEAWDTIVGKTKLLAAMQFIPAATVYAYSALVIADRDMDFIEQPRTASCVRGLARRLHREIALLHKTMAAT